MSDYRGYVVEATTPEGPVEINGEATASAPFAGVVNEMVSDYARDTGRSEREITVTSAWWVTA
jgi:hypothetical protein